MTWWSTSARIQFATGSLYHFLFVPLTLGVEPIVVAFQTLWYRTGNDDWLCLTKLSGALFLIEYVIGVTTDLIQEFRRRC